MAGIDQHDEGDQYPALRCLLFDQRFVLVLMMNVRKVWVFMRQGFVTVPMLVWLIVTPGTVVLMLVVHVMHMRM